MVVLGAGSHFRGGEWVLRDREGRLSRWNRLVQLIRMIQVLIQLTCSAAGIGTWSLAGQTVFPEAGRHPTMVFGSIPRIDWSFSRAAAVRQADR